MYTLKSAHPPLGSMPSPITHLQVNTNDSETQLRRHPSRHPPLSTISHLQFGGAWLHFFSIPTASSTTLSLGEVRECVLFMSAPLTSIHAKEKEMCDIC